MQEAQVDIGGTNRFNTFGENQSAIYATNKKNIINDSVVLVGDSENSRYYKGILLNKNFLINKHLTFKPDGALVYIKNNKNYF